MKEYEVQFCKKYKRFKYSHWETAPFFIIAPSKKRALELAAQEIRKTPVSGVHGIKPKVKFLGNSKYVNSLAIFRDHSVSIF